MITLIKQASYGNISIKLLVDNKNYYICVRSVKNQSTKIINLENDKVNADFIFKMTATYYRLSKNKFVIADIPLNLFLIKDKLDKEIKDNQKRIKDYFWDKLNKGEVVDIFDPELEDKFLYLSDEDVQYLIDLQVA